MTLTKGYEKDKLIEEIKNWNKQIFPLRLWHCPRQHHVQNRNTKTSFRRHL